MSRNTLLEESSRTMKNTLTSIAVAIAGVFFILPLTTFAAIYGQQGDQFGIYNPNSTAGNCFTVPDSVTLRQITNSPVYFGFQMRDITAMSSGVVYLQAWDTRFGGSYAVEQQYSFSAADISLASDAAVHSYNVLSGSALNSWSFVDFTHSDAVKMCWQMTNVTGGTGTSDFFWTANAGGTVPFYVISSTINPYENSPINFGLIQFPLVYSSSSQSISASSSLWQSISYASSSQACIDGNFLTNAICASTNYLFVPNPDIATQYLQFVSTSSPISLSNRIPFSYFYDSISILSSLQASTTQMVSWTIPFHSLGMGSTTAFGNFLPDVTILSSSTITYWIGIDRWNELQGLLIAVLYLGMAYGFWREAKYLAAKHH